LGRDEAPFFGAPRKEKREKKRESTPFFAVLIADGVVGAPRRASPAPPRRLTRRGPGQAPRRS